MSRTIYVKQYAAPILAFILVITSYCCLGAEGALVYRNGLLSANIAALDINSAFEQITAETDVVFSLSPGAEITETVSAHFSNQDLESGIRRLLVGYNYMMLYATTASGAKRVSKVIVLGKVAREPANSAPVAGTSTTPPPEHTPVILRRNSSGHYIASGSINDLPTEFIVDTGATVIALSVPIAKRIGLGFGKAKRIETASGTTTGYGTVLERVELGGLYLDQVPAVILPEMNLGERILLGMSFLSSFDLIQRNDLLTIAPRKPQQ